MNYYLKINQNKWSAYRNFQNWLDVIALIEGAKIFVICDQAEIVENIVNLCRLYPCMTFISSEREDPLLREICEATTDERWRNAGYAHLTAFLHAHNCGEECPAFWNIDADDTWLCVSAERTREILSAVEENAKTGHIDGYSLDMHTTRTQGVHWSFGITYTDNRIDWLKELLNACQDAQWKRVKSAIIEQMEMVNFDWFFTYLKSANIFRLSTYYVEQLRFIHYSDDFLVNSLFSGVYQWRDGYLWSPILSEVLQVQGYQNGEKIPGNVDCIDIGITEGESIWELQRCAFFAPGTEANPAAVKALPDDMRIKWEAVSSAIAEG